MLAAEQTYSQEVLLLWKQLVVCQCPQCVFCCLCTTCDLSTRPTHLHLHTHCRRTHTSSDRTNRNLCTAAHDAVSFYFRLCHTLLHTHTHTHTHTYKENNQMLVPPQQPPPLHQQLLPQQQVSRHPPPAAFCQRWNTGVFKPWTRAKHTHTHTHTCRVIKRARPAAVLAEDFVETPWVCSCVCLPCCVDSHNILWMSGWRRAWRN